MAKRSNGRQAVLECPVEFGGVSVGQTTARIGVRINRDVCNIVTADEVFCGHRLEGKVNLGQADEMPNQTKMMETGFEVAGSFDVKRIGVTADIISTGLTFSLKDINIAEFARFSKGSDPRDAKLERVFTGVILKGLLAGGLDTVGALGDYTAANKDLTQLPGIGPGKAETIRETMIEFFKQNA